MKKPIPDTIRAVIAAYARANHRDAPDATRSPIPAEVVRSRGGDVQAARRALALDDQPLVVAYVAELVHEEQGAAGAFPGSTEALVAAGVDIATAAEAAPVAAELWERVAELYTEEAARIVASRPRGLRGLVARIVG